MKCTHDGKAWQPIYLYIIASRVCAIEELHMVCNSIIFVLHKTISVLALQRVSPSVVCMTHDSSSP